MSSAKPKVFGIGLHKTGLTSLSRAMRTIGYGPVVQCPSEREYADIAKYAFANDMPIDMRYPRLHCQFPDAKFILTVRDFPDWLESALRHSRHAEATGADWNHADQRAAYGVDFPDEELLLARFDRHYNEVFTYFNTQAELGNFHFETQFLQLDICAMDCENTWFELCKFLGIDPGPFIMGMAFPCDNVGVGK